jgi:PAS domain S-box-containing protein
VKVLIVDDNDQSLYLLRTVLEGAGHEVWPAADGAEALALAQKKMPDAVITDIQLPQMDGFALCRALRQSETLGHLPILLYSATYTDAKDRALGLAVGADRFLEKPMEPGELLSELEAACKESKDGTAPRGPDPLAEPSFLREYNERLVRKLEDKMLDLERAYRELAESERRYHELFDVASDVIFTLAPDSTITLVNRRIQETLGLHPAEVAHRACESLVVPSARAQAKECFDRALAGQRISTEIEFLAADGRAVPMHMILVPLWQGQRPAGLMGVARDMSERSRIEATRLDEACRKAKADARRAIVDELEGPLTTAATKVRELAADPHLGKDVASRLSDQAGDLSRVLDVARKGS